jgi:uncharacterized membrane protein YczE
MEIPTGGHWRNFVLHDLIRRSWTLDHPLTLERVMLYVTGCALFSLGVKMFIDSGLGTDPLHAMIIGIVQTIDRPLVGIGVVESVLTLGFLLVWMVWNRRLPPLMTFVTMAAVGFLVDLWNAIGLERWTTALLDPVPLMVLALVSVSYASASIIMSGIGIRVMDLLAITFVRRLGWHFLWAKLFFEASFVLLAVLFGGPVGLGTLAFVLMVGTLIPPMMWASSRFLGLSNYGMGEPLFPVQRPAGGTGRG